jgi:hypothetical protein
MGEWTMPEYLSVLIEKARHIQMTEEQKREQRLSFVYGNTHVENSNITRQMIADADDKVQREEMYKVQR